MLILQAKLLWGVVEVIGESTHFEMDLHKVNVQKIKEKRMQNEEGTPRKMISSYE